MANGPLLAGLATAVALTTGNAQAEKAPNFSDLIDAGGAKVALVQAKTRNANNVLVAETQPILLAQVNIEDGRTGPYTTIIPQINGGTKVIEYFKNKKGLIIPPPVENGKLADGSTAPSDPLEAKAEQRSVIAKYDKVVLVKIEKYDIIEKAGKNITQLTTLAEQGKLTKEDLFNGFYSTFIVRFGISSEKPNRSIEDNIKIIHGFETYGKIRLKLSPIELETMKKLAEQKAYETLSRFSSTTA